MGDTVLIETTADEVVSIVTAGPQGPSGSEAATLTTTGDLLYRAALANDRLPIGSEGQVLKVSSGLPAWAAESGAVTSVNGATGAVTVATTAQGALADSAVQPGDLGTAASSDTSDFAAASHTHVSADITDATNSATANTIVKREVAGGASFGGDVFTSDLYVNGSFWPFNTFPSDVPVKMNGVGALGVGAFGTNAGEFAEGNHTHAASDITSGTLTHERGGLEADVSAYNGLVKITGGSTSAVTVTTAGEALLDDADAAAQRTTLGLGTAATVSANQDLGTGDVVNFDGVIATVVQGETVKVLDPVSTFIVEFIASGFTDDRECQFPDASGTLALTADLPDPSSATPQALGTAAAGTSEDYSRADHVHGAPALNDLSNVSAAAPSDNDVLVYDNATSTWVAEAPAAGGVSAIGASAADILSVSGSDIVADDAGADRIVFWDDSESKLAYLEAGSGLSISGTTMTVTATGGSTNLWIPASAWIPKTTAGCGVDSRETATNDQNFDELLFDAGTDEFADALVVMPSNYNNGTITARFYWTAASGSGGVAWAIQGRAFANDDALDTAAGTAQLVTDTLIAADDMHVTSATSAVTIGGTPAANTPIQFSIYRDVSDASDDLAVDARLLGVEIIFN